MFVPGRVCLLGEHCDWAGGSSLVAPMPLGIRPRFLPAAPGEARELHVSSHVSSGALTARYPLPPGALNPDDPLRYVAAVAAELTARGHAPPSGTLTLVSDLPQGRGFSSSAALCVAAARALAPGLGREEEADVAYVAERERVGVACGRLDPIACAWGQVLHLQWRASARAASPGLTGLAGPPPLAVAAFSAPRDTPGILAALSRGHRDEGRVGGEVRAAIARWGALATGGAAALERGDLPALGRCMDDAQSAYEGLMAELPALAAPGLVGAAAALRRAGALGAKFSGAGGDGSVIALGRDRAQARALAALLAARGLSTWVIG